MFEEQISPPVTTASSLATRRSERDLLVFRITSLNDQKFIEALQDPAVANIARTTIITVPVREANIASNARTGKLSTTAKEMHNMTKISNYATVVEYLHALDDRTLIEVAKQSPIRNVISENIALSHRFSTIFVDEDRVPTSMSILPGQNRLSFGGCPRAEIKITGDPEENMETLLATPQSHIREVLNPSLYIQDDVAQQIRNIVSSDEFKVRRQMLGDCACLHSSQDIVSG